MHSLGWTQRRIGKVGSRQWVWERYDLAKMRDPAMPDLPHYEITPSGQDILNALNERASTVEHSTHPARPAGGLPYPASSPASSTFTNAACSLVLAS
jgi:hypothetical protein